LKKLKEAEPFSGLIIRKDIKAAILQQVEFNREAVSHEVA
jgi:hypothetical protein